MLRVHDVHVHSDSVSITADNMNFNENKWVRLRNAVEAGGGHGFTFDYASIPDEFGPSIARAFATSKSLNNLTLKGSTISGTLAGDIKELFYQKTLKQLIIRNQGSNVI